MIGNWGDTEGDGHAGGLHRSTRGVLIGADTRLARQGRVGVVAGFTRSQFSVHARNASADSDNAHLGAYGGTHIGRLGLRLGAAYSWHHIQSRRSVVYGRMSDALNARHNAGTAQVFGEANYASIDAQDTQLLPFLRRAYVNLDSDGFTERGGAARLKEDASHTDTTFSTLGLRVAQRIDLGKIKAGLSGSAGWRHAIGDRRPHSTHAFTNGARFTLAGVPIDRNSAQVNAGVGFDVAAHATATIA